MASSIPSDQSSINQEPQLVLLYQNSHKATIHVADFLNNGFKEIKTIHDATINDLIRLIMKSWNKDVIGLDNPQKQQQIRLIHLGRQLDDGNLQINDLKLDVSDIIHVTVRPLDSIKGMDRSIKSGAEGMNDGTDGSKCCIIA